MLTLSERSLRPTRLVAILLAVTFIGSHDAQAQTTAASDTTPTFAGITGDGTGVGLSWWAVKGAGRYEVLRAPDPRSAPTTIASVSSTTLGYRDQHPDIGPVYYQLVAVLASGARATGAWVEYTPPTVTSVTPTGSDVLLAWSAVKSAPAGGYEVWRTRNPKQPATRVGAVDAATLTYRDKQAGLETFYYQIVAVGRGGARAASPWFPSNPAARSAADRAVAEQLAQELRGIGIKVDPDEKADLANAMTKGGSAAMAVALYMELSLAEFNTRLDGRVPVATTVGDPIGAPGAATAPAFQPQVDSAVRYLSSGPNASLAISQILLQKLKTLTTTSAPR